MLKVVMVKGRKLKKGGGDLEVHKQNVASSKQTIDEQNVVPLEFKYGAGFVFSKNNYCNIWK